MSEKKSDPVNHPEHYTQYEHEVIELTERLDFCLGNAVKYILRAPFKGKEVEDLHKALWYLRRSLERDVWPNHDDETVKLAATYNNEIVDCIMEDDIGMAIAKIDEILTKKRIEKLEEENELLKRRMQEREDLQKEQDEADEEGLDLLKEILHNIGVDRFIFDGKNARHIPMWMWSEK
jgi:hypothetical protein